MTDSAVPISDVDRQFCLWIEYDGTAFHGWQRQDRDRTVQGTIENALARMIQTSVTVHGAGRTDAGVHALGQVASFRCRTRIAPEAFRDGLNSLMPDDIVIHQCRVVPDDFHPRFTVVGKHYRYCILNRPLPQALCRQYCWHVRRPLDIDAMQHGADQLIGTHDFRAFEGAGSPRSHTVRIIRDARWRQDGDRLEFDITGNGFLRYMVRNIVGLLVAVGSGRLPAAAVTSLRDGLDRTRMPATAPAHGLTLVAVQYPATGGIGI